MATSSSRINISSDPANRNSESSLLTQAIQETHCRVDSPDNSSNQIHRSSNRKKLVIIKKNKNSATPSSVATNEDYQREDFVTPDKLAELRDNVNFFAEKSTIKNQDLRRVSFQPPSRSGLSGNKASSLERNLFNTTSDTDRTQRKFHMLIDATKLLKEKQNLLQTTGCSSIREYLQKSRKSDSSLESPSESLSSPSSKKSSIVDIKSEPSNSKKPDADSSTFADKDVQSKEQATSSTIQVNG